ncbi:MAG: acetate--CoA ligase family protein [Halobacteriales archaeon]
MADLSGLFEPSRVAVVGATEREGAVGRAITENLLDEFDGEVVAVNPSSETVLGLPCHDSLVDVEDVDMAVVVVPPDIALDVVETAGETGIDNVVVITAGFGESGSDGATRERRLKELAEQYDLNVVGPNSLGIMNTGNGMNASFGPSSPLPGDISFMSQSGAFVTAVLDWALAEGIGFRDVVSLGNKAVLDETDFLNHWGGDENTDVVVGYLEGIDDGRPFIDTTREVTRDTPVVLVKSGRTEAGAKAAASHTGTMAGSERAYEAGLEQAGVIRAETPEALFDYARAMANQPVPAGNSVGIVTNAGGPGVMTTDAIGDSGLSVASLSDDTVDRLEEVLPPAADAFNPVDVIGDADIDRFADAIDAVLADDVVDMGMVVSAPVAVLDYGDLADVIIDLQQKHGKPVVTTLMGGDTPEEATRVLGEAGIPNYFDPARAVRSLDGLARYRDIRRRTYESPREFDVDSEAAREVLESAAERGTNRLGVEAMDLLDAYGIPTPDGDIVEDPGAAVEVAEAIDGPVVMKIVSPDILHKSDIGGVEVGVPDEEVGDTYEDLVTRARNYQPDATILGVQVQEMVDLDDATETIVGVNRDPQFGPLVLFGLGGVFVEIFEDNSLRVAPVSEREAQEMVDDLQAAPLLRGARGREPADVDSVVETVQRVGQLATDFPAILELDVNPLVAGPDGVQAVDIRLTLDTEKL